MKFVISETDEVLVSHSGLALAGAILQGTPIRKRAAVIRLGDRRRPEVSHADVLVSMIGLLCLGKPDFEAIEAFRGDEFFRQALGLTKVPSEGTLRQRLDELEHRCDALLREESGGKKGDRAKKGISPISIRCQLFRLFRTHPLPCGNGSWHLILAYHAETVPGTLFSHD